MRILGHIHTFNDEEIIDRTLQALLEQTYPVDEIVLVDNASQDRTLARPFPKQVIVIRHSENQGTSGAVATGMEYALGKQYDWIYLLDADSLPRKDALQRLIEFYKGLPLEEQERVWRLSSLPLEAPHGHPRHGIRYTPEGCEMIKPEMGRLVYECDGTIWSGSLYKLSAVRQLGLPNRDYVLDWGEYEYGFLGKTHGYLAFMHQGSIIDHSVGDVELPAFSFKVGTRTVTIGRMRVPPIRLYYIFRNSLYFFLHVYHKGNVLRYLRQPSGSPNLGHLLKFLVRVVLLSEHRAKDLWACLRGTYDGLRKNLHHRY